MEFFLEAVLTFSFGKFSFFAMYQWKRYLERGIGIPWDTFIFIRIEGKIEKIKRTKFRFCKIFHAMQFISSFLFPVLKSSSPANEVNQVSQL